MFFFCYSRIRLFHLFIMLQQYNTRSVFTLHYYWDLLNILVENLSILLFWCLLFMPNGRKVLTVCKDHSSFPIESITNLRSLLSFIPVLYVRKQWNYFVKQTIDFFLVIVGLVFTFFSKIKIHKINVCYVVGSLVTQCSILERNYRVLT